MKLRSIRKQFHRLSEAGHKVTLILVAVALAAALLGSRTPVGNFERQLATALHVVHWSALALAVAYTACMSLFGRNVAKEIAQELSRDEPKTSPFISLFPRETRYRYQQIELGSADVTFVTTHEGQEWNELLRLNEQGFDRSAFEIDRASLERRNAQWIEKNRLAFMLVKPSAMTGAANVSYTGYTAVVPLTDAGADVYLRGLIKDRDLPASLMCGPDEPSSMLLIFAVALDRRHVGFRSLGRPHLNRLLKALEYHLEEVAKAHRGHANGITVWTQTEHRSISKHLRARGFRSTSPATRSGDGFELVRMSLAPAPASPRSEPVHLRSPDVHGPSTV